MLGILSGMAGFLVAYLFDLAALRGWRIRKLLIVGSALALLGYGFFEVIAHSPRFAVPFLLQVFGAVLLLVSSILFLHSEFIEIPLTRTYLRKGFSSQLVTTGTYALTRHPGVLWFMLAMVSLVMVTGSDKLLLAAPAWSLMDVIWVVLQDRFFFPRMLPGYYEYQKRTPMLFPTRHSIGACLKTISALYSVSGKTTQLRR